MDPWNGSGTTTFSASQLGFASRGLDLNPVMVVIAKARLLPQSEADAVEALARDITKGVRADVRSLGADDPLLHWFAPSTAALIRSLERRIRHLLVGDRTITPEGLRLENLASVAATFYVALFSVCRFLSAPYKSSNPTWLRKPKGEERISADRQVVLKSFIASLAGMVEALVNRVEETGAEYSTAELLVADSTSMRLAEASVDFVLSSPPYCTRIDYSAATRIELAVLHPLINLRMEDLGRSMIGSTRVPRHKIEPSEAWGATCLDLLEKIKCHPSKASSGYYYKTHLDYFDKMEKSLKNISCALKNDGKAVLVVQDSYYKDVHNDLPTIISEIAREVGLVLGRREDFYFKRSMVGINSRARSYKSAVGVSESVLCFGKIRGTE